MGFELVLRVFLPEWDLGAVVRKAIQSLRRFGFGRGCTKPLVIR
jgi:hypothetical protein